MRYLFPLNPWNQQRQFEKPVWVYPAHLAMYATYIKAKGIDVTWGFDVKKQIQPCSINTFDRVIENDYQISIPFTDLPYPDREFTDAKNKRWQAYGNYKFHPATHMMVSNLCWYGKCTFCIDTKKLQDGEKRGVRSVDHVMEEIDDLIDKGYKEVFDDSGTFPVGNWLKEFCAKMNEPVIDWRTEPKRPYAVTLKKRKDLIKIGCNMKPLLENDNINYKMMADAGFRFILVGIESANQETVDKIKKGQRSEDIIPIFKSMADAGLEPHLTSMFGYEWETHEDAMRTVKLVHHLLKKGYAKTAQASVYSPPRTEPDPNSKGHKYIPMVYDAYKSPEFWFRKITDIRCWEDITYIFRGVRLVIEEKWRKLWVK